MVIDLNKLESLAKAATPGPWVIRHGDGWYNKHSYEIEASNESHVAETLYAYNGEADAAYIVAACNSLPTLIAENRALQKRVQELEKQRNWLAYKHAVACIDAACDSCTTHIGDCPICPISQETGLCIEVSEVTFINAAEEATKEAGNDR